MGYLHFDRVKIPQENSIFNGSSSIQLSSVNELLKEHGIVLNNNENDTKNLSQTFPTNNNNIYNHGNPNEVFSQQSPNNDNNSLGLDDELTWVFNHNSMLNKNIANNTNSAFVSKDTVFENSTFSPPKHSSESSVVMGVNNVVTKFNRKDLLDLKVHKALVDIPGFHGIKEKYQCKVHKNDLKKGRGRKMKCCQTADDLFKLALKEKCQSIGIHDYSKLKRRRGRPRKSSNSSPSVITSIGSSSLTEHSKEFSYEQSEEPAGSGESLECFDQPQSSISVQFQLNQLQKQLNEQQVLLNEQMKSMNFQRLPVPKQPSMDEVSKLISQHNKPLLPNFQASFAPQGNFGFKSSLESHIIKPSLLQKQSQLVDINSLNFISNQQPAINAFENMLSPVSLNTPNLLSPGRFGHGSSVTNMNNILVNDLFSGELSKGVSTEPQNHNILDIEEDEKYEDSPLLDEMQPEVIETKVGDNSEIKPKKKYQKKTKGPSDKSLTHISGKKIEIDEVTKKMKCFHEGCDAQFKQKAYLSRHMKKHLPIKDHVCPFWSEHVHGHRHAYPGNFVKTGEDGTNLNSLGESLPFEKKLRQHGLLDKISDKSMNKYISAMQCHQKGFFTRKDEFMIHLKSFHVITDLEEKPDYAVCVECGDEFTSLKDWYENHLNTLSCSKIINKDFNAGRALRKQYEKETRLNKTENIVQEKTN